jgi:hypothetical protein
MRRPLGSDYEVNSLSKYRIPEISRFLLVVAVFIAMFIVTVTASIYHAPKVALEMILMKDDSTTGQYEGDLLAQHPDRRVYHIVQDREATQAVLKDLRQLVHRIQTDQDTTALIEVDFSRQCTYADFISVFDCFYVHGLQFLKVNRNYYSRLVVADTISLTVPL